MPACGMAFAAAHGVVLPKYVDTGVHVVTKAEHRQPGDGRAARPEEVQAHAFLGELTAMAGGTQPGRPAPAAPSGAARHPAAGVRHAAGGDLCRGVHGVLWVALALAAPNFLTGQHHQHHARRSRSRASSRSASCSPIILAGIDLSVGSVAGFGVVFACCSRAACRRAAALAGAAARARDRGGERLLRSTASASRPSS